MKQGIENIFEQIFYKRLSNRVRVRIENNNLSHQQIYPPDHKLISRIINNKRTKNNPFLVNDSVISTYFPNDSGKLMEIGLLPKLEFNSVSELLFGNEEEINCYLHELFHLLWALVTDEENNYAIDEENNHAIDEELYLCDYIPYARIKSYYDILYNVNNTIPDIHFGVSRDILFNNFTQIEEDANNYIYKRYATDFKRIFLDFVNNTDTFHMIYREFDKFIQNKFVPMLIEKEPDFSSLGLRVRDLIKHDLSKVGPIVEQALCNKLRPDPTLKNLINATSNYILQLEKIQKNELS